MSRLVKVAIVCLLGLLAGASLWAQTPDESWSRIGLLAGNIYAVAVSPDYDIDQTVYAGVVGAGLWRSTDRGVHWTHLSSVPNWETVTAIATHPTYSLGSGKPVYVGTFDGWVYASFDDFNTVGSSYKQQLTNGNSQPVFITALASSALYSNAVFAATNGGGVQRNNSSGVSGGWYTTTSGIQTAAYALTVTPAGEVFACITYSDGGPVFKYSGTGWANAGPSPLPNVVGFSISAWPDSSGVLNLFLGTYNHGMWRGTYTVGAGYVWNPACDGNSGSTTLATSVNGVAVCPKFGTDTEVWEGRGDGLRTSMNAGSACTPTDIGAAVKTIAFTPGYHTGGLCDVFVATDSGLFLKTCGSYPPNPKPTPPAVSASALALSRAGMPGTWAAGSIGLLRATRFGLSDNPFMLQYNASGSPLGKAPAIRAICIPPVYDAAGACGTDAATVFVAEWSRGVFKSTDHGNTWSQLATGWPVGSNLTVNDLAIPPLWASGGNNDLLFAATNQGLYRWSGANATWTHVATDWNYNFTHVALPPTYDATYQGYPYTTLFASTDVASANSGLWYSINNGTSLLHFHDAKETSNFLSYPDITSIAASPGFGVVDHLLFISRSTGGVYFTSQVYSASPVYWCALNTSIPSYAVRQLAVRPDSSYSSTTVVCLRIATDVGPTWWDVPRPLSSAATCPSPSPGWAAVSFTTPSGCPDTYAVTFAFTSSNGKYAALGTAEDGVYFSTNYGKSFLRPGESYRSLPDDVFITVPYARDNNYLFATSPTYGVFLSRDKGASFQPYNGSGCTPLNDGALGFGNGFQRYAASPTGWNIDVVYAGTNCNGIYSRPILGDNAGTVYYTGYMDLYGWGACTLDGGSFTGPVQKIVNLTNGNSSEPIEASSTTDTRVPQVCSIPGRGMLYNSAGSTGSATAAFNSNNSGLSGTDATSIRPGEGSVPSATTLTSGGGVAGSVAQGAWNYYAIVVPAGQPHLNVTLSGLSNDADLYVRYAAFPTLSLWDYRPYTGGTTPEVVEVYPTSSPRPLLGGVWFIGVEGYASGTTNYTITATLLSSFAEENPPAPAGEMKKSSAAPSATSVGPGPLAPAGTISWGTVSRSGVYRGTGTGFASAVNSPDAVVWEARNGAAPNDLSLTRDSQTVIQLSDSVLLAGQNGALWRSPALDEGRTTWEDLSSAANVSGSSLDVRDFLQCSNGDLLVAVNGTAGLGGVWLSGCDGTYWMALSQGFDASSQKLESLVRDSPATGKVQYYAGSDETGSWTRSITAPAYPTVTTLSATSGPATGGTTLTITGTGFSTACPTGTAADCPFTGAPMVLFGKTTVLATYLSATQIQVTAPRHGAGAVTVTVVNPDTRAAAASQTFTFTGETDLLINPVTVVAGKVRLAWDFSTSVTVQRATNPQFSAGVVAYSANGTNWTDPSGSGTDGTTYYYRLQ